VNSIFTLLFFWIALNLVSAGVSGLVFRPFGSPDSWMEYSLFLAKLFIGAGLFWFSHEEYGIGLKSLLRMISGNSRGNISTALKYLSAYVGMLVVFLLVALGVFTVLDGLLPTPGGNSHLLGIGSDHIRFKALAAAAPGVPGLFLIGALILAPIIEEVFYRGLFFAELRKKFNLPVSILISSLLFGMFHSNILVSGMAGAYLAYVYEKKKSLPVNIFLHSLLNAFDLLVMTGLYYL
jgi:membrane protease YdiL (CAAX protease family)